MKKDRPWQNRPTTKRCNTNSNTAVARNACSPRFKKPSAMWMTTRSRPATGSPVAVGLMGHGACGALTGGLMAISAKFGRDRDKLDAGRGINNFKKSKDLVERFRQEFGGITCQDLQKRFTGRTYDMWNADEYKAFDDARGTQCAHATALVTKWVVETL